MVSTTDDDAGRPSAHAPVTEFAGQLFFRLWRATHTRTAEALRSVGLTPALFALLNVVAAREGSTQQQLGATLGIDRTTMVSLVDELERSGLARRRASATDRRVRQISITAKGRRRLERARELIVGVEDEVLTGLTAEQRGELTTLLRRALDAAPPLPPWSGAEGG